MAITPEMLTELIDDTIAARRSVEQRIRDLESQASRLSREREQLLKEEEGHRLTLERLFPHALAAHSSDVASSGQGSLFPVAEDLSSHSRTDAVEAAVRALSGSDRTASPAEIEAYLRDHSRDDTRDQIGAALSYLRVSGRIDRHGRGQWSAVSDVGGES